MSVPTTPARAHVLRYFGWQTGTCLPLHPNIGGFSSFSRSTRTPVIFCPGPRQPKCDKVIRPFPHAGQLRWRNENPTTNQNRSRGTQLDADMVALSVFAPSCPALFAFVEGVAERLPSAPTPMIMPWPQMRAAGHDADPAGRPGIRRSSPSGSRNGPRTGPETIEGVKDRGNGSGGGTRTPDTRIMIPLL